jgi:hypothetical protein
LPYLPALPAHDLRFLLQPYRPYPGLYLALPAADLLLGQYGSPTPVPRRRVRVFPGSYTYRCPVCRITVDDLTRSAAGEARDDHREEIHGSLLARPDGESITRSRRGAGQWRAPVIVFGVFVVLMLLAQFL